MNDKDFSNFGGVIGSVSANTIIMGITQQETE